MPSPSLFVAAAILLPKVQSLILPPSNNKPEISRRDYFGTLRTLIGTPLLFPLTSNAIPLDDEQQGIPAITDSPVGKAIRRSVIQGARVADSLDERWERFSDKLRDKSRCDKATGRRLYDNGVRKDGTSIGNPGLGALCDPVPIMPLSDDVTARVLNLAVQSALDVGGGGGNGKDATLLTGKIEDRKKLVASSFERREQSATTQEEKKRVQFNFELYATLRAITNYLNDDKNRGSIKNFQIKWGQGLVQMYAPLATRDDYKSPFPQRDDEYQDYDYDKNKLLDALGKLTAVLAQLKEGGWMGYYEISIPYDDYGSVVTVAIDDYVPIGTEILLSEQGYKCEGPIQALVKYLLDASGINFTLDTFYIDPSTTRQTDYNPTQLLLSMNNLRAI